MGVRRVEGMRNRKSRKSERRKSPRTGGVRRWGGDARANRGSRGTRECGFAGRAVELTPRVGLAEKQPACHSVTISLSHYYLTTTVDGNNFAPLTSGFGIGVCVGCGCRVFRCNGLCLTTSPFHPPVQCGTAAAPK